MFQIDHVEVGQEADFMEDGAHFRVRLKEKKLVADEMSATLTVLEVFNGPTLYSGKCPEVGTDLSVGEYKNTGAYAGWTITPS